MLYITVLLKYYYNIMRTTVFEYSIIYILIDCIVILEDIFYKTGSINPAGGVGKWPLMTRAHLAQAVVSVALADKEDGTTVIILSLLNL